MDLLKIYNDSLIETSAEYREAIRQRIAELLGVEESELTNFTQLTKDDLKHLSPKLRAEYERLCQICRA